MEREKKMIQPIFKSKKLQSLFEKKGFVKVPLLNNEKVQELVTLFNNTREQHETTASLHHTTTDTANPELIYRVDSKIKSVLLPELEKILQDFKPLASCFHIKEPGEGSATGAHQDPTFVDESKYCSANVWVALQDIDKHNGNLYFISGSNRAVLSLRVTPGCPSYYESFHDSLPEMEEHIPLKKGEAVIFSNATIHGAPENLSSEIRLAATLLVCSRQAEWLLYYKEKSAPNDKVEQYYLNLDTFVSIPKNGRPDSSAFQQYLAAEFPQITKSEFIKRVNGHSVTGNGYLQKIKDAFGISS